ncbi:glycoside hydrolase family 51 protein [Talaromyces proteolyticus]|uniref:non-reducing end alpha-L-arabinofuranosidase n=1 Tax=Talaromyces proteolyticus TaxID=1131652 RepID=A0AAD4KZF0_9EURO|nr:glycoside hydrolase family 51 protein [Talaromyces proteolyticus]KAH8703439.1 glycoside hydrolase family 51 protein [Talaromyces proteolyticus]
MASVIIRFGLLANILSVFQVTHALTLNVSTTGGNASSPILYGLLFEDVYHSGDGGLYAELVQNRAFQGTTINLDSNNHVEGPFQNLDYWHSSGPEVTLTLDNQQPSLSDALPYHMRVDVASGSGSDNNNTGFWNEGFWGMNITTATRYAANFYLRGDYEGDIVCAFWSNTTNSMLGNTTFTGISQTDSDGWKLYQQTFTPFASGPDEKNTFHLTFDGTAVAGSNLRFNMISVFQQTWKNGNNGLRMDLAEAMNDIGGKYLRMPGGNNLEGQSSPYRWKWNETIGSIIDRPGFPGTWGYYNTNGLGLLEMMQWCIDMGLETILGVWGGYYLDHEVVAEADLQPYIDDVLNELEFLLGPENSTYGSLRASLGYPDPFTIKYVEIGNEDFFDSSNSYINYRFSMFSDAIKAAYPDMIIISSIWSGYFTDPVLPNGTVQDLHDYFSASDMVSKFNGYDNADRNYPVLVGEYAAIYDDEHTNPNQLDNPTLQSATSEAVYILGLERNSDLVVGFSHGALIKSLHDEPDNVAMMKHSPTEIVLSMSYYVAKLFATNYGSQTVPVTADTGYGPLYWSVMKNESETYFVKIVNYDGVDSTPVMVNIPGKSNEAKLITLTAPDMYSSNLPGNTTSIWTETTNKKLRGGKIVGARNDW